MKAIDTTELSDELWEKYFEFQKSLNLKYYENKKTEGRNWREFKEKKNKRIELLQLEEYKEFIILNEDKVVGWYDRLVTPINILFGFDSTYEILPEEFIQTLFNGVFKFMVEKNMSEAFWWSFDKRKLNQIFAINAEKSEDCIIYKMEKVNADLELFKSWIRNTERKFKYHAEVFERSSEFNVDKYAEFVRPILEEINSINPLFKKNIEITNNDVKNMILMNERSDFLCYYYILFNEFNEMIAVSSVLINKLDPHRIHYDGGLTGVHKNYRGNGFGKYLKAKMFFHLLKNYPDFNFITTDTMPWNNHMFKINEELGFKPYKTGARFRFTKEFLENYLQINKSTQTQ